jgi:hypothetical protein
MTISRGTVWLICSKIGPPVQKSAGPTTDDSENGRGCNTFELSVARIHSNTSGSKDLMHAGG